MAHGMMIYYPKIGETNRISFRKYEERGGRPVLERLDANMEELAEASRLVELYTMKFVILANDIIEKCKLPQLG